MIEWFLIAFLCVQGECNTLADPATGWGPRKQPSLEVCLERADKANSDQNVYDFWCKARKK